MMPAQPDPSLADDPVSDAVATYFRKRDQREVVSEGELATSFPGTDAVVRELSAADEWLSRITAPFREPTAFVAPPEEAEIRPPAPPQHELLSPLGKGAMGVVFLAKHTELGREVAIKYIQSGVLANEDTRKRFRREAQTLAALNHPHVVHVYDCGRVGGYDYCVMELVRGGTLSQCLDGQPWSSKRATELMAKLGQGVAAIHNAEIVHRDLKPANVFLTPDGNVKVGDFGLARAVEGPAVTGTGVIVGTPWYMSPEQSVGKDIGPAADVWSLGVIYYQLLTGRVPFPGTNPMQTFQLMRTTKPEPPANCDPAIAAIAMKCLAFRPEDRYANASEFARAVADAIVLMSHDEDQTRTSIRQAPQSDSRVPMRIGVIVAVLAFAVGLAVAIGWKDREPAVQPATSLLEPPGVPLSSQSEPIRPVLSTAERLNIVAADLRTLPEGSEREHARYFSVDHLPTESQRQMTLWHVQQTIEQLRGVRPGSGLRGSLHNERSGVYAVDIREWGWDASKWLESVAKNDPYRLLYTRAIREDVKAAGQALAELTSASVVVRGDWFVARFADLGESSGEFETRYRQSTLDIGTIAREYGVASPGGFRDALKDDDTLQERDPLKRLLAGKPVTRAEWERVVNGTSAAQEVARTLGLGTPMAVVGGSP